jgi:hypothetical protein
MGITSRVSLGLEKSVEVPERALNVAISLHLFESHLDQNFHKLLSGLHQEMKIAVLYV